MLQSQGGGIPKVGMSESEPGEASCNQAGSLRWLSRCSPNSIQILSKRAWPYGTQQGSGAGGSKVLESLDRREHLDLAGIFQHEDTELRLWSRVGSFRFRRGLNCLRLPWL